MRLRRLSIQATLEEFGMFFRRNLKRVTISTFISVVLGLCYLFLKLTPVLYPEIVPYSDLIMNLQSGSVSKVLFEEGSRRIFYNTASKSPDNPQLLETESPSIDVRLENAGNGKRILLLPAIDMLRRLSRNQVSTTEWQFLTRRIEYDEKFLLGLMREKGTAYSSAPQSVLMSMRNILVTILSLWIPLTPFMWLLYRQFSAANSPAKKRCSSNQTVSFDDVEGVDTAKIELNEQ